MVIIIVERLPEGSAIPPDIPGQRVTINLHELPQNVATLQGAIDFLTEQPNALPPTLRRLLELYRGRPLPRKPQ